MIHTHKSTLVTGRTYVEKKTWNHWHYESDQTFKSLTEFFTIRSIYNIEIDLDRDDMLALGEWIKENVT